MELNSWPLSTVVAYIGGEQLASDRCAKRPEVPHRRKGSSFHQPLPWTLASKEEFEACGDTFVLDRDPFSEKDDLFAGYRTPNVIQLSFSSARLQPM